MKLGNKQFYWVTALMSIIALIAIVIYRLDGDKSSETIDFDYLRTQMNEEIEENLDEKNTVHNANNYAAHEELSTVGNELFTFDPNLATVEELVRLGLTPKVAQTINNYRNKGGKFYKPTDFQKIYTLKPADYQRLLPYIVIRKVEGNSYDRDAKFEGNKSYQPKTNHPINVNTATVEVWQQQKGIGQGFASRIVAFREKLGGFRKVEQLKEVYGLPDSTYQNLLPYMQISLQDITYFNINTIDESTLSQHPYVGPKMASNIIKLRTDMGRFSKIEDLKMVPLINEEKYRKIAQYFKVD